MKDGGQVSNSYDIDGFVYPSVRSPLDERIQGISLRDKIALEAMIIFMSTPFQLFDSGKPIEKDPGVIAKASYTMADAMMKARNS